MATNFDVKYHTLAEAIPALSFAAAANVVDKLTDGKNFNMNVEGKSEEDRWPTDGHDFDRYSPRSWLHSDIKNVALSYITPVFDKMIDTGELNKLPLVVPCPGK